MAEPHDVDARLAEGRAAVDNVGDYVWACHLLGYHNPDLTLHSAQVRDWYGGEDGLDLRALESDRSALESVATAAEGAQQLQDQQVDTLADAWHGRGGDASRDFLLRHAAASAAATSAVRNAVDVMAGLRDDLWRAVDEKVVAAVEIDDRRQGERAEWQAATRTVTTGAGDRAAASELVDQQVKPFVDNDIRSDWLAAMQKAMAAVSGAFDAATGLLTAEAPGAFEVPGDLGPAPASSLSPGSDSAVESPTTAPAGWAPPVPSGASAPSVAPAANPMTVAAPPLPAAPLAPEPSSMPSMPSLGEMGGGLPGGAGGLAGLGSQLADAIGGLLSGTSDSALDPPQLDDRVLDETDEPDFESDDEPAPEETDESDEAEAVEVDEASTESPDACADGPAADMPPEDPVPTTPPPAPSPAVEPPPTAEPLGAATPCEIAADELPQAGP